MRKLQLNDKNKPHICYIDVCCRWREVVVLQQLSVSSAHVFLFLLPAGCKQADTLRRSADILTHTHTHTETTKHLNNNNNLRMTKTQHAAQSRPATQHRTEQLIQMKCASVETQPNTERFPYYSITFHVII